MSVGVDTHAHHLKYIPLGVIQVVPPKRKALKGLTQPAQGKDGAQRRTQPWVKPVGTVVACKVTTKP